MRKKAGGKRGRAGDASGSDSDSDDGSDQDESGSGKGGKSKGKKGGSKGKHESSDSDDDDDVDPKVWLGLAMLYLAHVMSVHVLQSFLQVASTVTVTWHLSCCQATTCTHCLLVKEQLKMQPGAMASASAHGHLHLASFACLSKALRGIRRLQV